jgi:hypothetical protein
LPEAAWFGHSVSVLLDKLINQLLSADNVLAAWKAPYLHVTVRKDIHFHPLPYKRQRDQHSILTMAS